MLRLVFFVNLDSFATSFSQPKNTQTIIGIVDQEKISVLEFNPFSKTFEASVNGNMLFEIGSISKIFTTSLLSILVSEDSITLNDSVKFFLPELSNLPEELNLLRLATHTSGLPKMPSNAVWSMLKNRKNPFKNYSTEKLMTYVSKFKVKRFDQHIRYSNIGVALLGHILAEKLNLPYEKAIQSKICSTIGMTDTGITLTAEQHERMAEPRSSKGNSGHNWDLPAFSGAGALKSSVNDLIKFIQVNLDIINTPLSKKLESAHGRQEAYFTAPGISSRVLIRLLRKQPYWRDNYHLGIGLGWIIGKIGENNSEILWHHGATGCYLSWIGLRKERKMGIVILTNRGPKFSEAASNISTIDELGFSLMNTIA